MSNHTQKVIENLEEKVAKYESLLGPLATSEKKIGTVVSEDHTMHDIKFYRVDTGGGDLIVPATPESLSTEKRLNIKKGDEVMIQENTIVDVIPKKLQKEITVEKLSLVEWKEIGGMEEQIKQIRESVEIPLNHPELMIEYGLDPIAGILLYGPPGNGKTLIAKAIAHTVLKSKDTSKDAFIHVKGSDILDKFVGESEKRITALFEKSRRFTKKTGQRGVIFLDEAEALLSTRGGLLSSHSVVPSFLSEMDGMAEEKPLVILATNLQSELDPAILRDGRIDLRIKVDKPTEKGFSEILSIHLGKRNCIDNCEDLSDVAAKMVFGSSIAPKVSGAMTATIVKFATKESLTRFLGDNKARKGILKEDVIKAVNTLLNQHNL